MEMKITLSMPSTISSTVSVTSATRFSTDTTRVYHTSTGAILPRSADGRVDRSGGRSGERRLGLLEDVANGRPIGGRQVPELGARVGAVEHLVQAPVDVLRDLRRKRVETLGINQKTQRVLEQPAIELEVAKGTPLAIANGVLRKVGREPRCS